MWWMLACTKGALEDAPPSVLIDEVMTRNDSTVMIDGRLSDWVEIVNVTDEAIAGDRLSLETDEGSWSGDLEVPLVPGEHRLLWANDDHLGFTFAAGGDHLTLLVDGEPQDRIATGDLPGDVALARIPSGRDWAPTAWPTPGNPSRVVPSPSLDPSDALFSDTGPLALTLGLPDESRASLEQDRTLEVPASLGFDTVWFPEVAVRLKGQWGSQRDLSRKAAFKIDVDDYGADGLRGLEHLTLNNAVQDPTYLHEALTYSVFEAMGIPAPRVGWVELTVNDERFGLYVFVETIDDHFLARRYAGQPSPAGAALGPVFEGAYGCDFAPGSEGCFELDQGDEADRALLSPIVEALQQTPDNAGIARLERLIDLDEWLDVLAVEAVTGHWDGYYTQNNYRIYLDPVDGRWDLLPWGVDQTWQEALDPNQSRGLVQQYCLANDACRARHDAAVVRAADLVDGMPLIPRTYDLDAWIRPLAEADPRAEYDVGLRDAWLQLTRDRIANNPADVRSVVER